MIWKTTGRGCCACFILLLGLSLIDVIESRQIKSDEDNNTDSQLFSSQTTVAIFLSALSFLVVVAVVIFKCTDCYNSEVSTECHPASNGTGQKWGGSVGYSTDNTMSGAVTFGEVVNPDHTRGLPYAMIPTSVPEQAGFQGYHTGEPGSNPSAPVMGYQAYGSPAPATSDVHGSRHYNPAEGQPPPPAYSEALRGSSLHGFSNR